MNPFQRFWKSEAFFVVVAIAATAYLGFQGLGDHSFWDDEAQVATVAKTLVRTGELSGWDGRNLLSYRNGNILDQNLRIINAPMHYYQTAFFFWLFDTTDPWAGRFPSVLFGLAALVVFWLVLRQEIPQDRPVRLYALALMTFSYSFLLNIRQSTYYASVLFFGLLSYFFFTRAQDDGRIRWFVLLGFAFVLMFFAHFLLCAALMGGMGLVFLSFYCKKTSRDKLYKLGLAGVFFIAITVPYALAYRIWERQEVRENVLWLSRTAVLFYQNLRELDLIGYLPGIVVAAAMAYGISSKKKRIFHRILFKWALLVLGYLLVLSFLSIQPPKWHGWSGALADIRYLVVLLPFCCGILASILGALHRSRFGPLLGGAVAVVILCTNLLSFNIAEPGFRWLLPAFVREIHQDYDTPYDAVIAFLRKNAKKDEVVYAYPEHHLNSIQAHLGDLLRIQGLLRGDTLLPIGKLDRLDGPKFINDCYPDWIVLFGMHNAKNIFAYFSGTAHTYFCTGPAGECPNAKLNIYYKDTTRPELPWHSFGPVTDFDPDMEAIHIYKKMPKK